MSAPKYLIDTNVIIGLEDWKEVSPELAALTQIAARHGVGVFVHAAARDDIARDPDVARRSVSLSGASGKWDATSLGLERYTGYRSGLGRLR